MGFGKTSSLKIGDLKIKKPIIQGGMGVGISLSGLASAVANEGGVGVIATPGIGLMELDINQHYKKANSRALINEIKKARKKTNGVLGVNIMLALSNSDELIYESVKEGIDIIFLSAGLPIKIPKSLTLEQLKNSKTKFVPIVSSARSARIIFKYWDRYESIPDAVVIEGPKAGGHLGFKKDQINNHNYSLEKIFPEVIEEIMPYQKKRKVHVPVVVAGGIYSGADIYKYLELGADGIQMGTRFVATHECDASDNFKRSYLNATKSDITIIDSPVGLPGRVIKNSFINDVDSGIKKPFKCPMKCLRTCDFRKVPYCIADALANAKKGNLENGFAFAGENVFKVNEIISVKELFKKLEKEYDLEKQYH